MSNKKLGYKLLTPELRSDNLKFIENLTYSNVNIFYYNTIIETLKHQTLYAKYALIEINEENGINIATSITVIKILTDYEVNDILISEYKMISFKYPQLILTGSLALHLYQPLLRNVRNINVLIDMQSYLQFNDIISPCYDFDDSKRSWGIMNIPEFKCNIYVLIKNTISYNIINGFKVSTINDILRAKMFQNIVKFDEISNKDIWNYLKFNSQLSEFYNEHSHFPKQYIYLDDELPF